jgi:endonuclease VIII
MPEGDTVWLSAQRLNQGLSSLLLTVFDLRVPELATVDLRGTTVTEVLARGKHLLTRLDDGHTLHSHLRMDGSWYLSRTGQRPRRHPDHMIRAQLGNAEWLATGYRVHDLRLVATSAEAELVGHLGPDLLGPDWDLGAAVERLQRDPAAAIGDALLDQRNLAGIGNLYKSEACFLLGVHPLTPTGQVDVVPQLIDKARRLLQLNADRAEQTTTGNTRRGQRLWVYGRAGQPCRRCRTPIASATWPTVADGSRDAGATSAVDSPSQARVTFWCPMCQPEQ